MEQHRPAPAEKTPPKTSVLIVDDLDFMRAALRQILEPAGYRIVGEAVNGLDALRKVKKLKPQLVILDITMPEMDGITALGYLRRLHPAGRVVMCSALGDDALILKAIRRGAADYVVKPYSRERLLSAVEKAVRRRSQ